MIYKTRLMQFNCSSPVFCLVILGVALTVKLCVSEIECDVDCDHGEVENVEEKAKEEDKAHGSACKLGHCGLKYLSDDSEGVAHKNEHLEEKALSFGGFGDVGFSY